MIRELTVACVTCLLVTSLSASAAGPEDSGAGSRLFERMKTLVGQWEGTYAWTGGRTGSGTLRARYALTAAGSALVEDLLMGGEVPTMSSVYHLDGDVLRMTHYCAARNQPRLKAERIDGAAANADFGFVDVTNVGPSNRGHVEAFRIEIVDPDHINLTFTFGGGPPASGIEHIRLHRVRATPDSGQLAQ